MNSAAVWAVAFAFVGFWVAVTVMVVQKPPEMSPQIECIKARGKWVPGSAWSPGGSGHNGTCDFTAGAGR